RRRRCSALGRAYAPRSGPVDCVALGNRSRAGAPESEREELAHACTLGRGWPTGPLSETLKSAARTPRRDRGNRRRAIHVISSLRSASPNRVVERTDLARSMEPAGTTSPRTSSLMRHRVDYVLEVVLDDVRPGGKLFAPFVGARIRIHVER